MLPEKNSNDFWYHFPDFDIVRLWICSDEPWTGKHRICSHTRTLGDALPRVLPEREIGAAKEKT